MDILDKFNKRLSNIERYINSFYSNNYIGTVFDNNDPLKKGRIKIQIPKFNNIITNWAMPKNNKLGGNELDLWIPKIGNMIYVEWEGNNPEFPLWSDSISLKTLPDIFAEDYPNVRGYYTDSKFYTAINETKKYLRIGNDDSKDYFCIDIGELQEKGISKIKILSHNDSSIEIIEDDNNSEGYIRIKNKSGDMFEIDNKQRVLTLSSVGVLLNAEENILAVSNGDNESIVGGNWNIFVTGNASIKSEGKINLIGDNDVTDIDGVITGKCICHYTGKPHGDKSSNVFATKGSL